MLLRQIGRVGLCVAVSISLMSGWCPAHAKSLSRSSNDAGKIELRPEITLPSNSQNHENIAADERNYEINEIDKCFVGGSLQDGEKILIDKLNGHPSDDQARFGLGMIRFLRAIEGLAQDLHCYGLDYRDSASKGLTYLFDVPIPRNPNSPTISYSDFQMIIRRFASRLTRAEASLATITDKNLNLPIHFGLIKLDLDENGILDDYEALWRLYDSSTRRHTLSEKTAEGFVICFDRGDVHWLRGYCHLLLSLCDFYLAHDSSETFKRTSHVLFPNTDSKYKCLLPPEGKLDRDKDESLLLDGVALIHSVSWEVSEPERMKSALKHLEAMVAQNKLMWNYILSETDDEREWIPNPEQRGVIPNVKVTSEMVETWREFMGQIEEILAGRLLVAFWRGEPGQGVNVRKFFLEPRKFDLVYWAQGSDALPYLEKGKTTKIEIWNRLNQDFGNQFPGFAAWFN
ncbi:MAG: hypothetical protein IPM23_08800 [Candidatus Melainabacteria bacterium]|nr:hypothetical protein [Candidatus Melainabacteria bacterium]